jgi:hydroxymethylpyrimidine/phosphomethylpyrimidine kinase
MTRIPNVLTIAGSDPSGGAGIQADLKTFSALGAYGCAVLTALTAQNTRAVTGVHPIPPDFVARQIDTLVEDVDLAAAKVGMVADAAIAEAVADALGRAAMPAVVVDPVMVAKSGDRLLDSAAVASVRDRLLPLATVVTPNLPEAGVLLDRTSPSNRDEMADAAADLAALGPRAVLLKGGHLADGPAVDLLWLDGEIRTFEAPRLATRNTHGTGCTLSSAIAALLPRRSIPDAVAEAKAYVHTAIAAADHLTVGSGHGPTHHFHALWTETTP